MSSATASRRIRSGDGQWRGPTRPYDIAKEFVIALVVVSLLSIGLAALFSSPDEKAITLREWATNAPNDFSATVAAELAGTSGTATYGAPYVDVADAGQKIGPVNLQKWAGVRIPVDSAKQFVVDPLTAVSGDGETKDALAAWTAAPTDQQQGWASAYADAIAAAPDGDPAQAEAGDYGPVPVLTASMLSAAQRGGLDGPVALGGLFYQTDYTTSVLFLADGTYLEDKAVEQHLGGGQWGMMNETGSYPGQAWLWLYSFWYQIKPFNDEENTYGANADALIWAIMMLLTLGFVFIPFIPGVRDLPRWIPVHRLVWKRYYAQQEGTRVRR